MKIGIDISRTADQKSGLGAYVRGLLSGLVEIDNENSYYLYPFFWDCFPEDFTHLCIPKQKNFKLSTAGLPIWVAKQLWLYSSWGKEKIIGDVDLVHSTGYTSPLLPKKKLVVTVHDLSFFTHPHTHFEANRLFCVKNVLLAVRQAECIIADSYNTQKDIFGYLHLAEEKVKVIHLAADPIFHQPTDSEKTNKILKSYQVKKPYLFFLGAMEPRKNLKGLLKAFHILLQEHPEFSEIRLVIAGAKGWLNTDLESTVIELHLMDRVQFLGFVPDVHLVALFSGCEVFVYPSFYEGFGLPVLEAMACGCAVVTSNISSLPEVAGEAALFINPSHPEEISEALYKIISQPALAEKLKQKSIIQAAKFSWSKTAAETLAVYKQVLEN